VKYEVGGLYVLICRIRRSIVLDEGCNSRPPDAATVIESSRMDDRTTVPKKERLTAELESLRAWQKELVAFISDSLEDPEVTREDFASGLAQLTRVLLQLKAIFDETHTDGDSE